MSQPKPPPSWADAVARVLGDRDPQCEQALEADPDTVKAALEALVATGRCLVTGPHGRFMPVTGLRDEVQNRPGFGPNRKKPDPKALPDQAFALEGDNGSWIFNVTRLTYLPPRRGAPAARVVFHLQLGPVIGHPFLHHRELAEPQLLFGGGWLLLTDADLDVPYLLGGDVNPADLDSLGEAVRGRPRVGYVAPAERLRKEDALAAVKTAYLAHRGPVPRALQQQDVDIIVRTGLEHGLLINLDLVHAATDGRGSPNAVYPKLADAMWRLAPGRTTTDDIDPTLVTLWAQLRTAAAASAEELMAPQRDQLDIERAALEAEREDLQAERDQDARAATERHHQQARLEQELAQARERIESLSNVERGQASEIASLSAERTALRSQLADATHVAAGLRAELATGREAQDTLKTSLAQHLQDAAAARARAESTEVDLTAQRDRAITAGAEQTHRREAVEKMHANTAEALEASQREVARALDELAAEKARSTALRAEADTARKESDTTITTLRRQLAAQTKQLSLQDAALATSRAEHQAVQRERDRLDALLSRLGAPPPAAP